MTIEERILELKTLRLDIARDIEALEALEAGVWSPPKPGDTRGDWGVDEHYNLTYAPTGAEFTTFDTEQVAAVLHVNKDFDPQTESFIHDWLAAARAGAFGLKEAE